MCINIKTTIKSLLEAHALIETHSPDWTPKMPIFPANFKKIEPTCNKGPLKNVEKNRSNAMQKHLEFVSNSKFLVVHLQQIVPLNKVHCF